MTLSTKADRGRDPPILKLELERNPEAPSLARAAIVAFCQDSDSPPSTMETLMLLVSEVVTNAVIHPDVLPPGKIGLYARLERDGIRVEVTDRGNGFIPKPRDPTRLGSGFGLYLLEQESAQWGVEAKPYTTVWFEVATPAA